MAVKVRCPTCDKVLNAPDAARGKAVKCPECETKVKVPAGNGDSARSTARPSGPKTAKKPAPGSESTEFLAGLDFNKIVDSSSQMCPKCGAEIPDDQNECPKCGVDISTGQLSAAAKKRKSRKGPDPAEFYSAAWKDSWAFVKENYTVALRTAMYLIVYGAVEQGCAFMVGYCQTGPPKVFWAGLTFATALVQPGWLWFLTIETIRVTVARKRNIRDLHFDLFQNIALGVKWYLWLIAFCWFPPAIVMYPLAMIHFAMPVTKRAWVNFLMSSTFFRNFAPTMYYWLIVVVTNLVVIAGATGLALVYGAAIFALIQSGGKSVSGAALWIMLAVLIVGALLLVFVWSFTMLFQMRVIGLLAYYFQNTLDLVTLVEEKTYVAKAQQKVDAFGNPIRSTGQIIGTIVFVLVVIGVIVGVGFLVYYQLFKPHG
jgi:ssDNA-binding Zn-finger/Zn-ribbon topoisomerase 1